MVYTFNITKSQSLLIREANLTGYEDRRREKDPGSVSIPFNQGGKSYPARLWFSTNGRKMSQSLLIREANLTSGTIVLSDRHIVLSQSLLIREANLTQL